MAEDIFEALRNRIPEPIFNAYIIPAFSSNLPTGDVSTEVVPAYQRVILLEGELRNAKQRVKALEDEWEKWLGKGDEGEEETTDSEYNEWYGLDPEEEGIVDESEELEDYHEETIIPRSESPPSEREYEHIAQPRHRRHFSSSFSLFLGVAFMFSSVVCLHLIKGFLLLTAFYKPLFECILIMYCSVIIFAGR